MIHSEKKEYLVIGENASHLHSNRRVIIKGANNFTSKNMDHVNVLTN